MKTHLIPYRPFSPKLFLLGLLLVNLACPSKTLAQKQPVSSDSLVLSSVDQINAENIQTVFSQKTLRMYKDSLLQNGLIDKVKEPEAIFLSQDDYIQKIEETFADQLEGISRHKAHVFDQQKLSASHNPKNRLALSEYGLSESDGEELQYLYGYQLDTATITAVKNKRIKQAGEKASKFLDTNYEGIRKIDVVPRQGFKERVYLEAVFALTKFSGDGQVLYASPAFGVRFLGPLSIGLGPDIQLNMNKENERPAPTVGIRSFLKASFWENKIYAQVEDIANRVSSEGKGSNIQNDFYAGGGYIMQLSSRLGVNFALLYNVRGSKPESSSIHQSPWMFRLGLSVLKITNK